MIHLADVLIRLTQGAAHSDCLSLRLSAAGSSGGAFKILCGLLARGAEPGANITNSLAAKHRTWASRSVTGSLRHYTGAS